MRNLADYIYASVSVPMLVTNEKGEAKICNASGLHFFKIRTPMDSILGMYEIIDNEYDLKAVLQDLINMTKVRLVQKDVKLQYNIGENVPSKLYGEDLRIKQVLTNILGNAAKFT